MTDLASVQTWLLTKGRETTSIAELLEGLVGHINAAGLQIDRAFYGSTVLHPQVSAVLVRWEANSDQVKSLQWSPSKFAEVNQAKTPLGDARDSKELVRYRLEDLDDHEYADIRGLMAEGYTDYALFPVLRGGAFEGGLNFCTKAPGGLSDDELQALSELVPAICTVMDRLFSDFIREQLLCAYLGRDAGRRVFEGQVRRGDQQTVEAAIWFSDLRGFTALSERSQPQEVIEALNQAFEVVVEAVHEHRGQVLKFMGDGLLGMFLDDESRSGCDNALAAARVVQERLAALRTEQAASGQPQTSVGVGLHFGDVTYGNIGAESRLDFTVIGRAVNLASRIEGLCSKLGANILASSAVAERAAGEQLQGLGRHEVKGVAEPIEVFGLVDHAKT